MEIRYLHRFEGHVGCHSQRFIAQSGTLLRQHVKNYNSPFGIPSRAAVHLFPKGNRTDVP